MPRSRDQSDGPPKPVRSVGDCRRVLERIMEIAQEAGRPAQLKELGNLLMTRNRNWPSGFDLQQGVNFVSQQLTIYRYGKDWAARDVTGAKYGSSPDLFKTIEAAERLARKIGATVVLSSEAQNHLLSQPKKPKG